ncbi:MAG: response regulator transcription factor [Chlamydiae bacterium]|nr:response regulator transcription factor [Chlamydiota bacterium]MBI3266452.1 response regulator transcription factor [Chlamydiota bacterium]
MPKKRVLIIEDDDNISKLIAYNLEKSGFETFVGMSGEEAFKVLDQKMVDFIILDLMLPGMDGLEVCRLIRQDARWKRIPVLMLTAKGEEVDRVVGLELGADDYMVKPFSPRELVLRIKAILRRVSVEASPKEILEVGALKIDIPRHEVTFQKRGIELTPMEFKLLCVLIERRGRVQSRDRLLADVWDVHAEIDTRTIDTHVKRLREKLGKAGDGIETVRGMGYKFKEE